MKENDIMCVGYKNGEYFAEILAPRRGQMNELLVFLEIVKDSIIRNKLNTDRLFEIVEKGK